MKSTGSPREIVVEPEHHIPVSKKVLVNKLSARAEAPEGFLEFCRIIEAVYHFENLRVSQELKEDFRLLEKNEGRAERAQLDPSAIHDAEVRFLTNFVSSLTKANFRLLSQRDVDFASQEEYLFNLPVQVDWDRLDSRMLGGFLKEHSLRTGKDVPEFASRILVFRRGVGVDRSTGLHLLPKIDALVTSAYEGVVGLFRKKPSLTGAPGQEEPPRVITSIHTGRKIERISLRNIRLGPGSLFRRTTLQEPTFKELVILFRLVPPEDSPQEADTSIYIKAFRDIPMADLEVVFPEKKISMKPLDLIKLVVTGTIGLVLFILKFAFVALLNPVVALAALATLGGYASKIFFGFKASRDRYQHLVTQSLYHKNLDNDLGVIFYLMDSLESQDFKESVLAYFCLLAFGPATPSEIDAHCERVMHEECGVEIDFEVDDALDKLSRDQLVECVDGRYSALPVPQALSRLDEKWDKFFAYTAAHGSPELTPDHDGVSNLSEPQRTP